MLKAVIFDLDGLLVDSTPVHFRANELFLKEYGKLYLRPQTGSEGKRMIDIVREYKDIYDLPGEVEDLYEQRQKLFYTLVRDQIELFPGAWELVTKLQQRNLRLALATSGDRYYVDLLFSKYPELGKAFSVVVTSEDVIRGKPAPDVFLKTLKEMNIKASEAVILEDSVNGIAAGKAAGIQVICVPNKNYPDADYSLADKVFPTLSDVAASIAL